VLTRPVVARVAPPPAPPAFAAKVEVIRQNRGAPVDAGTAARIVEQRGRPESTTAIRPVAPGNGGVTLSQGARREGRGAPASASSAVQPIAPVRGRPMATVERPVLAPAPNPVPAVAPPAGNPPAANGNPPGNPRGESWRNRQQPPAQAQPHSQPQPQVVQPTPGSATGGEPPAQDHRRRTIDRQPAGAPTAVVPPNGAGAPPANGTSQQDLRRQTNRGRRSLEQTPQPTPAPGQSSPQPERGRRSVPPGQAQPQPVQAQPQPVRAQPQPAPQPAQAQPAPQAEKHPDRPAPEARGRGRGNADKPTPAKKDEKKEEKKPD
jgi:hypothetical protein